MTDVCFSALGYHKLAWQAGAQESADHPSVLGGIGVAQVMSSATVVSVFAHASVIRSEVDPLWTAASAARVVLAKRNTTRSGASGAYLCQQEQTALFEC